MKNLYRSDVKEYGFSQLQQEHVLTEAQFLVLEDIVAEQLKKHQRSSYDNSKDFILTKDLVYAVRDHLDVIKEINTIIYGDEQ